jgi:hypothetical protein
MKISFRGYNLAIQTKYSEKFLGLLAAPIILLTIVLHIYLTIE